MDRKESIKTMLLGAVSLPFLKEWKLQSEKGQHGKKPVIFMQSQWDEWPDMEWVGPEYWGNRLQDWQIRGGQVQCSVSDQNRSLHCLTHQLHKGTGWISAGVTAQLVNQSGSEGDYVGFRIGAKAKENPVPVTFEDYRRAAVFGEGLDAGVTTDGHLFIGSKKGKQSIDLSNPVRLMFKAEPEGSACQLMLKAIDNDNKKLLDQLTVKHIAPEILAGNLALVSHFQPRNGKANSPSVRFADWRMEGSKLTSDPAHVFGPICFAQYTLDRRLLKMTAQLAPVEAIEGHSVELQIREEGRWQTVQQGAVHPLARTAHFRLEGWDRTEDTPYRIKLSLPLHEQTAEYFYEGTIAADPISSSRLKSAVFSCNSHYGFPNMEVVEHVAKHQPDMAVFLGDQIYESHGGFGIQRAPVEKASLDFLRKWYMFGWSYRDIFRHIPSAFIPDDHDVYHGNIWGQGGKEAPTDQGWGAPAQDQGGYKMPPEWVNMVQRVQTSHLPDPYDPTPVRQDISVYYTDWVYGGISFAILEDRKFKTAPRNVLPEEAKVINGFIQNRDFDIKKYYDIDAELLGERQLHFLEHWTADWSGGVQMKAVLSQTNFCTLATLPEGSITDDIVPRLSIPERGTYVKGDAPTIDMDSNGWPQKGRDKALRAIRKGFALHIAGDQHLASTVQYGVEEFGDAGFAFAGPALNNFWPRRWWPPVGLDHKPLPGRPGYTGNFEDRFGNKMTVFAVGNPTRTHRKPSLIYDRASGYGMVTFDKTERTITIECWPRYVDPEANPPAGGQYEGWPVVIDQQDNYGRQAKAYLPEIVVEGMRNPVVEIHNEETGELEYALRISGSSFTPKVFDQGTGYTIRIGDPDRNVWREYNNVRPGEADQKIKCIFT